MASSSSSERAQPSSAKTVAFLGPLGSYTHQATKSTFLPNEWELTSTGTIKDVFDVVQAGEASYGIVPFENSTHGIVTFTLDNLADRKSTYPDLHVCGEVYLEVHHYLVGRKNPDEKAGVNGAAKPPPLKGKATPLASLSHIKHIYSHPQGFGQTGAFVSQHLRGVETIDVASTSKAAEMAAQDPTGTTAAIASEMAADLYGLDVLARCIEDRDDNTTRFFVIRRDSVGGTPALPARLERIRNGLVLPWLPAEGARCHYKSLVSFTVPHHAPGALADVLDCFRRFGLNLTSINSVPSLVRPFQYLFLVEFEGSRFDDPIDRVKRALEAGAKVANQFRFLGSWENQT